MTYTIFDDHLDPRAPIEQWESRVRDLETELTRDPKNEGIADYLGYARSLLERRKNRAAEQKRAA